MTVEQAQRAFQRDMARRVTYPGTLSDEEKRLLLQGFGQYGTDYEKLLREESLGEYA